SLITSSSASPRKICPSPAAASPCLVDTRWQQLTRRRVRWRTVCWPSKDVAHQLLCPCVFFSFLFFFDSYYGDAVAQAMLQVVSDPRSINHSVRTVLCTEAALPYSSRHNNERQRHGSANLNERTDSVV
ncbi:hypothetical protein CCMA1212_003372, partial [Trichoderma ghanense]